MAQLRNRFNIRDIVPESRTRVKILCKSFIRNSNIITILSRIFKVLGKFEKVFVIISLWKILLGSLYPKICWA